MMRWSDGSLRRELGTVDARRETKHCCVDSNRAGDYWDRLQLHPKLSMAAREFLKQTLLDGQENNLTTQTADVRYFLNLAMGLSEQRNGYRMNKSGRLQHTGYLEVRQRIALARILEPL